MNLAQAKYKSKFYYDQKQNTQHFREGEMVYLMKKSKYGKMDREYVGPCEIIEINYSTHNAKRRAWYVHPQNKNENFSRPLRRQVRIKVDISYVLK